VAPDLSAPVAEGGFRHIVWTAQGTTPAEIEAALRRMLVESQASHSGYGLARALNMVCVVDSRSREEVAARLRGAGRYHASRTIVCVIEPGRATIDATAEISSDVSPGAGELALLREMVTLELGQEHVPRLESIVDPLVVTDLPTLIWSPDRHWDAVRTLLPLAQAVLLDSTDEPEIADGLNRACELLESAYVVDLSWLRSTPWRERVATTFDPPDLRPDLRTISAVTVRHHPESAVVALLLVGWLASRLDWGVGALARHNGTLGGALQAGGQDVQVELEPTPSQQVRGLAGLTLETATGRRLSLDRGRGGLEANYRNAKGEERRWTVLGASRGEPGILGEGIRQALLRDPTYGPATRAASRLVG
jgi:glucose-6-phosphate dehydrogenase assembly protein OpcA